MEKEYTEDQNKNQLELWAFCAVIGTAAELGLGIAEDHGNRNRNDMGVDTGKNPYSVLYGARVYCGRSHYRDISKVIRGLSGRYGNSHGKSKEEKRYEYKNMLVMMIAALLPLLIGSSVGPEAGLTGIIVGLCYWAGENLKFAKQNTKEYSQIGAAVSLSVLFHAPLFGIFEVEEDPDMQLAEPGRDQRSSYMELHLQPEPEVMRDFLLCWARNVRVPVILIQLRYRESIM